MFKCVELADTVALMNRSNFEDNFRAEYLQLSIRLNKLENMLRKIKDGTLTFKPRCSYELLHEQLVYMKQYQRVLEERVKNQEYRFGYDD